MEHPIYGLDQAIANYLHPVLTAELGNTFLSWVEQLGRAACKQRELTRQMNLRAARHWPEKQIALQEDLLPGGMRCPPLYDAWAALLAVATPVQRSLCELYASVFWEQRDLENMALSIQVARENGDPCYAVKVEAIMGLEEIDSPIWLG